MAIVFLMNEEIARGMVCFFHQKKHSYLIYLVFLLKFCIVVMLKGDNRLPCCYVNLKAPYLYLPIYVAIQNY
jgi:hypothetical protein